MSQNCPTQDDLKQFVEGRIETSKADAILSHLETCDDCSAKVDSLEKLDGDTVLAALHQLDDREIEIKSALPPQFSQYEIIELLGEGGMGAVYRARHPHLGKEVAVKVIKQDRLADPAMLSRFQREIKTVAKLDHPNIVRASDAGVHDGTPYLVMELLDGNDLSSYVKQNGSLSIAEAVDIIRQAASGLAYAHQAGIVHRDIKPSNLFLLRDGNVKILDLGIAKNLGIMGDRSCTHELGADRPSGYGVVGSPDFMAPEQISGVADIRSDIYSLGCTLAYLLTGKNRSESQGDLPESIRTLLARMTAGMPDQRFHSMPEVLEALANIETNSKKAVSRLGQIAVAALLFAFVAAVVFFGTLKPATKPSDNTVAATSPTSVTTPPSLENKPFYDFDVSDPAGYDRFIKYVAKQAKTHRIDDSLYEFYDALQQLGREAEADAMMQKAVDYQIDSDPYDYEAIVNIYCFWLNWAWKSGHEDQSDQLLQKARNIADKEESNSKKTALWTIISGCVGAKAREGVLIKYSPYNIETYTPNRIKVEQARKNMLNEIPAVVQLCNEKKFAEAYRLRSAPIVIPVQVSSQTSKSNKPKTRTYPSAAPAPASAPAAPAFQAQAAAPPPAAAPIAPAPSTGFGLEAHYDARLVYIFEQQVKHGDLDGAKAFWLDQTRTLSLTDCTTGLLLVKGLLESGRKEEAQRIGNQCFIKAKDHERNIMIPILTYLLNGLAESGLYEYVQSSPAR